jgi:peptidoglycan hydrolase-like protein with peptidoglycan-binding domain
MIQLRVLKSGMSGDDVLSWQKFLKAQGFTPTENGTFNDDTVQATVDFQRYHSLPATGRADNMTFGRAMTLGLQVLDEG